MSEKRIIGILLIKNEDLHIERVIRNIVNFCDLIIINDHQSDDHTYEIIEKLAVEFPHISINRIDHPKESHISIEKFANTPSWIFIVDGDEIYDPDGLSIMRNHLLEGHYDQYWNIFCNTLNCVSIDYEKKVAKGFLAPPSRAGARLFNFSIIESWTDCPERVHGGTIKFLPGFNANLRYYLHNEHSWEDAFFRCVHLAFVKRSSKQSQFNPKGRLNPVEIEEQRKLKNLIHFPSFIKFTINNWLGKNWKNQKYRRGKMVTKNIPEFLS